MRWVAPANVRATRSWGGDAAAKQAIQAIQAIEGRQLQSRRWMWLSQLEGGLPQQPGLAKCMQVWDLP